MKKQSLIIALKFLVIAQTLSLSYTLKIRINSTSVLSVRPHHPIMTVVYRVKVGLLCHVWKKDIMLGLLEVIRKAAEEGNQVEEVKARMWSHLNTLIDPFFFAKFASCHVWHMSKDQRSYTLHIYVPSKLNVIVEVEGKVMEDLRSSAAVVVADHLANEEEAEKLDIPKNLVQEVRGWVRWKREF